MGICSSCLGLNRYRDASDDEENTRLFDDVHTNQYGSFSDQNAGIIQADPQEVQRETEALQKVVTNISNHLVDIFAMVPQRQPAPNSAFPGHDARLSRYQDVLTKISANGESNDKSHLSVDNSAAYISDGWISEEDDAENEPAAKPADVGPLLGGFADAETVD